MSSLLDCLTSASRCQQCNQSTSPNVAVLPTAVSLGPMIEAAENTLCSRCITWSFRTVNGDVSSVIDLVHGWAHTALSLFPINGGVRKISSVTVARLSDKCVPMLAVYSCTTFQSHDGGIRKISSHRCLILLSSECVQEPAV